MTPGRESWHAGQVKQYIDQALVDNGVVELRILSRRGVATGIYSDREALIAHAAATNENAYVTMNAPRLRAPTNALRWLAAGTSGVSLNDADILRYTRIAIDFDPVRPKGLNSSDAELAAARELRESVVAWLAAAGWPAPSLAMSGNGYHALYRCKLDVTPENVEIMRALYRGLAERFSTPQVTVDRTLFNPSRILRAYGTVNRKGPHTDGRPQRRANVRVIQDWRCVLPSRIRRVADLLKPAAKPAAPQPSRPRPQQGERGGDYNTLDIVTYMRSAGLYKRQIGDRKHAVICPWASEHSDEDWFTRTDTVVWEAGGAWPQFKCSHAHCADRRIIDVIRHLGDATRFCARSDRA